jgi:hypothetical protein
VTGAAQPGADTDDNDNRDATQSREAGGDGSARVSTGRFSDPRTDGGGGYALLTGAFEMGDPFYMARACSRSFMNNAG